MYKSFSNSHSLNSFLTIPQKIRNGINCSNFEQFFRPYLKQSYLKQSYLERCFKQPYLEQFLKQPYFKQFFKQSHFKQSYLEQFSKQSYFGLFSNQYSSNNERGRACSNFVCNLELFQNSYIYSHISDSHIQNSFSNSHNSKTFLLTSIPQTMRLGGRVLFHSMKRIISIDSICFVLSAATPKL